MISPLTKALLQRRADRVPAGWLTLAELAREEGVANPGGGFFYTIRQALRGPRPLLREKQFRIVSGWRVAIVTHYRRTRWAIPVDAHRHHSAKRKKFTK